jgi:formylglycine-generating enzyme required for sulfatase activity/type II secretory pathway pseudopilin PulG
MLNGFRLRDLIAVLLVCGLAGAALAPAIGKSRESARQRQCADNLRSIGVALRQYHDVQGSFPPAAVWEPGTLNTLLLYEIKRFDRIVHENWAQLLLPHLGRTDVAAMFDAAQPVMAGTNKKGRMARVAQFVCPTDRFNGEKDVYGFQPWDDQPALAEFARGNYAINGGSHSIKYPPQSTTQPRGETMRMVVDHQTRRFAAIGNGVAGINHTFRLSEFANGQATLVAVDEVRAGVHPLDMRGVWALGHIGSSITWAHGVVGDACGPNNQSDRSDDIFDCGRIHRALGSDRLEELGMPCCWYIDLSEEATARSQHPGGVHTLYLDGTARFVHDNVDRGLWHVMHSRETPSEVLADVEREVVSNRGPKGAASRRYPVPLPEGEPVQGGFRNSIAMDFASIPAGTFTMGIPDEGNSEPAPPECPEHQVRITRAFWLGKHEVTQVQFQAVMGTNPSQHLPGVDDGVSTEDFPVENVTWYDALAFCEHLSELPAERAQSRRYRLPTEAEWEYACRSGKREPYRWKLRRQDGDTSGDAAGIEPPLSVVSVGSYPANGFGLYDMRGNVWEWCSDWFDRAYYSRAPINDPQGPDDGYLKVVRGGDWMFVGEVCRINYPIMSPWRKSPFVGFRVVCDIEHEERPQ